MSIILIILEKGFNLKVIINGQERNIEEQHTLKDIIESLNIEDKVMACAVNMDIIKKENWKDYIPKEKDKIELLNFVGGGWFVSRQKGDFGEKRAISFLEDSGFTIIETNFYAKKLGEIDIIAKKDDIYHFCEVKSGESFESAIRNITKTKLSKVKRSVEYYLQIKNLNVAFCVDAIIVTNENIEKIENITM